jgi:hypothetical protein
MTALFALAYWVVLAAGATVAGVLVAAFARHLIEGDQR